MLDTSTTFIIITVKELCTYLAACLNSAICVYHEGAVLPRHHLKQSTIHSLKSEIAKFGNKKASSCVKYVLRGHGPS